MKKNEDGIGTFFRKMQGSYIVMAVAYVVFGLSLLIKPELSTTVICYAIGAVCVIYAVANLIKYFTGSMNRMYIEPDFVLSVIICVFGIVTIVRPSVIISILPFIVGIVLVFSGLIKVQDGINLKRFNYDRWFLVLYDRLHSILQQGVIGEIKHISCQYGFVATGARKERKFNPALGGGALLDIGIYNLGFLRIVTGNEPQNVETQKVHINEYGTDDYSCLKLTYNDGCTAESVQTIGQELKRNARIEGTKGSIFLPDFQHAETMILEVEGKEPETIECPVDINGFEYEIREVSRCVKLGYCSSDVYTVKDSIALTRLMYDIRMSWS